MNELPSLSYVEDCLSESQASMQNYVALNQEDSKNFSNNVVPNMTRLPSLEQSFLHSNKNEDIFQDPMMEDTNFCRDEFVEKIAGFDNLQHSGAAVLNNTNENHFEAIHPYLQTMDQKLMEQNNYPTDFNSSCHPNNAYPQNNFPPSYEYVATQINIFQSAGFYHGSMTACDPMNSKSSLSSLESLASSISAVPILDPELFNLSKERKLASRSSRNGKPGRSCHRRRKSKVPSNECDSERLNKNSSISIKSGSAIKKEFTALEEPSTKKNLTYQQLHQMNASQPKTNGTENKNEIDFNTSWLSLVPTSSELITDVEFVQPTVLIPQATEDKENQSLPSKAVYTDLSKINLMPSKCTGKFLDVVLIITILLANIIVAFWSD